MVYGRMNRLPSKILSIFISVFLTNGLNAMSNVNGFFQEKILSVLTDFLGCDPSCVSITQFKDGVVNCYNNMDYKVTVDGKNYFVKVANPNGEILGTSVQNEFDCGRIAYEAGLSPKILMYDPKEAIMIAEFIEVKEGFNFKKPMAKERHASL